jgi:sugar lactone lactonase YvrE
MFCLIRATCVFLLSFVSVPFAGATDLSFSIASFKSQSRQRRIGFAALCGVLAGMLWGSWNPAEAQAMVSTATALATTAAGSPVTTVASGTVVTLTATVTSGSTALTVGQVKFCDATAAYCTDIHLLGTAQLTSAGTAVLKFRPGAGSHSYNAVFVGTNTYAGSSSGTSALTVTIAAGQSPSATLLSSTGSWGSYNLTATVEEFGGMDSLTGNVSFQDTSNGNAVLATVPLASSTPGLFWATQVPCANAPGANAIAVADLNGDGYPDYVILESPFAVVYTYVYQPTLGCYQQIASYATGTSPLGIVVSDFNSDGIPDLAIANAGSNVLTILLGHGDGTFTVSSVATGQVGTALVTADFNGDGIPDLAVASEANGSVAILLGNGDGTFTAAPTLSVSSSQSLATGDFNGDGKIDLAVAESGGIDLFTGNGDGTFNAPSTLPVLGSTSSVSRVIAGDFNRDGKVDLAVSNGTNVVPSTGQVTVLLGNGDGTFTAANPSTIPNAPVQIAVADFNLDGNLDFAALDLAGTVTVLTGKGDGTFDSPAYTATTAVFTPLQGFAVADMDGDGRPDILYSAAYPPNHDYIYFGLTRPTQTASTVSIPVNLSGVGQHLVVASYAGDANATSGVSDPATLWGVPPATSMILALTANGIPASTVSSGTPVTFTATVARGGASLTTGQVNFCDATANDCIDIHLVGSASLTSSGAASYKFIPGPGQHSYKAVLVQNGLGAASSSNIVTLTVNAPASVTSSTTTTIAQSGTVSDYSLTATVVGSGSTAALSGSITFLDTSYSNTSLAKAALGASTLGLNWNSLSSTEFPDAQSVAGDFNGDGIPDLAVVYQNSMTVAILLGNGDGTFKTIAGPSMTTYPTSIVAGDFNGDGKLDLAVSSIGSNYNSPGTTTIFLGNADGTFSSAYTATGVGNVFAAADFNGDGKLDLLVNEGSTTTVILHGNGDGTFAQPLATGLPATLAVADLNGDGIPDLVLSSTDVGNGGVYSYSTQVYLGNGDGNFRAGSNLPLAQTFNNIAVGDFNGDGIPDLVGISTFFASPVVYLGKGDGTFTEATAGSNPDNDSEPSSIALADFNGDGKLDIVITNGNSYSNSYNPDFVVMLGNGDGTFTSMGANTSLGSTSYPVVADFNGDGKPELAMQAAGNLVVLQPIPTVTAIATANGVAPTGPAPHLVDASYPGDRNYSASTSGTTSLSVQVAVPVILPASGNITSAQYATITEATPGATIYYQASGVFNTNGYVQYTAPIPLEGSGTLAIQAYASETGYQQSGYVSATYTMNFASVASTPVISLASGSYASAQTLTITDTTPGAQIYYTTNGTYPSTYSNLYSGPITVSTSEIVVAIALAPGYSASGFASAQYEIGSSSSSFIYTIAGSYTSGYSGDGGPATFAELNDIEGVAVDGNGDIYITDTEDNVVRKVAAGTGIITTIAGTGVAAHAGDNGPAASAEIWSPRSLAVDPAGNLFIGETGDSVVRRIDAVTGQITTFAGNPGGTGSIGGPATDFKLYSIDGIACDHLGNLYIAESSDVVEVSVATGNVTEIAGASTNAGFEYLNGIAVDKAQNIYVSDYYTNLVSKINSLGAVSIFAGTVGYGIPGGDGGPATNARLNFPAGLAVDGTGNVYIADNNDFAIREVNTSGIINTVAGVFSNPYAIGGDGSPAFDVGLFEPQSIAADTAGDIYFADQATYRIRKISAPTTPPTTAAPAPVLSLTTGSYSTPQTLTMTDATPGAEIYVSLNGSAATTAGQGYHGPIDITGTVAVQAIAIAPGYLVSTPVSATYTITAPATAVISTVAGNGQNGFRGFGGPAINANLGQPEAIAFDGGGDLYIADPVNSVVWMVAAATGNISVVAGTGTYGDGGDGGQATATSLSNPSGVAVDKAGNLYIADKNNDRVRMVAAATGVITTIAGPGVPYYTLGDDGPATSAFVVPNGLALDRAGNLYIADSDNGRIRMIAAKTGIITTVAGGGTAGQLGDGGLATAAYLSYPYDLRLDSAGNLYISDSFNARIRKVDASTGLISTVAGNGNFGNTGDGGPATSAEVSVTEGIAVDGAGNIYLSNGPETIRKVDATTDVITTIAGDGYFGYGGDGGTATMAELNYPQGLALDAAGSIYIADADNYVVRKVSFTGLTAAPMFSLAAGTYTGPQTVTITDSTQGATIYYTTDGTNPTTASNLYSSPIIVSATEKLQAIAVATGYAQSPETSAAYTITSAVGSATATVTATPSATTITNDQSVTVQIAVAGSSGQATPAGTVTLSSGSYTSQQTLSSGAATFTIAAGTLSSGADTLTADYSGDPIFASATATTTITVSPVVITVPAPSPVSPGASTTATVTLSAGSNYSGKMNLACTLTASPNGAVSLPTCSLNPASVTIANNGSGTAIMTVNTTAASGSALVQPPGLNPWGLGGGAVLVGLLMFGTPSRRRWMLLLALICVFVGAVVGCGGGGAGGGGQSNGAVTPATTEGNYTFTVTGTDSTNAKITSSANITVTVN